MATEDKNNLNNITRRDALDFMKGRDKAYVIDVVVRATLYGEEYKHDWRYNEREMSYFCRAFNITEYMASKSSNRIKGRYEKYADAEGVEDYYRRVLMENWPGFEHEEPRMDLLLANYVEPETDDKWKEREKLREQDKDGSAGVKATPDHFGFGSFRDFMAQGNLVWGILGLVVLVTGIVVMVKTIGSVLSGLTGAAGMTGEILGKMTFWEILSFLTFYGGIIYGIVLLVKKRNKRKLLYAAAVFVMSFLFSSFGEGDMGGILLYGMIVCALFAIGNRRKQ